MPPPLFPLARPPRFARMPPAVFPALLGVLGLGLAWRRALVAFGQGQDPADLILGMAALLWAFAVFAYLAKLRQRAGTLAEDLRVLPGRSGLAAASMGGMAVAAALAPLAPLAAQLLLVASLATHAALAVMLVTILRRLPAQARPVDPAWHLSFTGFIVGGVAACDLGWTPLADLLLFATLPVAALIWGASLWQFLRADTPPPLRPLLTIHLAPAALFATVAALLGHDAVALASLGLGGALALALLVRLRWLTAAGFSPMWGAFTFPLAAYTSALILNGLATAGAVLLAMASVAIPVIAWKILTLWGAGSLAAKTNAAQA